MKESDWPASRLPEGLALGIDWSIMKVDKLQPLCHLTTGARTVLHFCCLYAKTNSSKYVKINIGFYDVLISK